MQKRLAHALVKGIDEFAVRVSALARLTDSLGPSVGRMRRLVLRRPCVRSYN